MSQVVNIVFVQVKGSSERRGRVDLLVSRLGLLGGMDRVRKMVKRIDGIVKGVEKE